MTTDVVDDYRRELRQERPAAWFVNFARAMVELQGDTLDVVYFLDRPEKWATELVAWRSAGAPTSPDDDGWQRFAEDVEGASAGGHDV